MKMGSNPAARILRATLAREFLSYRINRFLHLHLALMLTIGALGLLAPPEAAASGATWWMLHGVIYVASLSALLLGLSSAQAEAEEFPLLFSQPLPLGSWVGGKCLGLLGVAVAAAILLVGPALVATGGSGLLLLAGAAAGAVTALWAWIGLALGLWIQDPVRGLIASLVTWVTLLFGVDLLLILVSGADWVQASPAPWVAALMLSPLDAYRVTLLFVVERAAFSGAELHPLTRWWLDHAGMWLAICLAGWSACAIAAAVRGAVRRRTC
jgi:hypothetical protein